MSKSINLLPDPILDTQRHISSFYQGTVISLIGLIIFFLANLVLLFFSQQVTDEFESLQQRVTHLQSEVSALEPIETKVSLIRRKVAQYTQFVTAQDPFELLWEDVTATEADIEISSINFLNGQDFHVDANTPSLLSAVRFLLEMRRSEHISDFKIVEISYDGSTDGYVFSTIFIPVRVE